jgi:hypothetical protein
LGVGRGAGLEGGSVFTYIHFFPEGYLLKLIQKQLTSREICWTECKYMKIHPIINALVWPLFDLARQTYTVIQQNFMRKFSIDFVSSEKVSCLFCKGE